MGISKEGWLIKNGQRRFFRLTDNILSWFKHPTGSAKGSVEVLDYYLDVEKKSNTEKILILTPKNKEKKVYKITGPTEDVDSWNAILDQSIRYSALKKQDEKSTKNKQGWLDKKGQKRWFLIKGHKLYWFTREVFINADFGKDVKGYLDLVNCSILEESKAFMSVAVHIKSTTQGIYILTAKSKLEHDEWIASLESAIQEAIHFKEAKLQDMSKNPEKRGYLIKKGKRRFFVLKGGILSWHHSETADKVNGRMLLSGCSFISCQGKPNSFLILVPEGDDYELTGRTLQEKEEWMSALECSTSLDTHVPVAVKQEIQTMQTRKTMKRMTVVMNVKEKRGWLMKKGQRRFFVLKKGILLWFVNEQYKEQIDAENVRGYINLKECSVEKNSNDFSFSIHESKRDLLLTAKTTQEADEWVAAIQKCIDLENETPEKDSYFGMGGNEKVLKRGALNKKGLIRWFELNDDTLRWFEDDNYIELKNSLPLYCCSVTAASKSSIVISTAKDKSYVLQTVTEADRSEWLKALQEAIANANRVMDLGFEKKGWLEKKGKKRYVVLKNSTLMWFAQHQKLANCTVENSNNSIDISDFTYSINNLSPSVIVLSDTKAGISYHFKTKSVKEAKSWLEALSKGRQAHESKIKASAVFGRPLHLLPPSKEHPDIPAVLSVMTAFLCQNGLQIPGIFRVACNYDRRDLIRDQFEKDPHKIDIPTDTESVHVVASLLKVFLLQLPDPVVPFCQYKNFIGSCKDKPAMKSIIDSFPSHNISTFKHIASFLKVVASQSLANQMGESNLCIVFAPNIIRSEEASALEGLVDMPKILFSLQCILEDIEFFFDGDSYDHFDPYLNVPPSSHLGVVSRKGK